MDDEEKGRKVAALAERRLRNLRRKAAMDVGARILEEKGSVTQEEVRQRLLTEYADPDPVELLHALTARVVSMVRCAEEDIEHLDRIADGAREKIETYRRLLAQAQADFTAAREPAKLEAATLALEEAQELLAHMQAARGDVGQSTPASPVAIEAGIASAIATVGGGS